MSFFHPISLRFFLFTRSKDRAPISDLAGRPKKPDSSDHSEPPGSRRLQKQSGGGRWQPLSVCGNRLRISLHSGRDYQKTCELGKASGGRAGSRQPCGNLLTRGEPAAKLAQCLKSICGDTQREAVAVVLSDLAAGPPKDLCCILKGKKDVKKMSLCVLGAFSMTREILGTKTLREESWLNSEPGSDHPFFDYQFSVPLQFESSSILITEPAYSVTRLVFSSVTFTHLRKFFPDRLITL